jgi:transcriptional regulator with XRE-family HTH domain
VHFYDVTLSAKKPQNTAYPKILKPLGDHLRKRRIDLNLYQKDVAKLIGVDSLTFCNWENNLTSLRLYLLSKALDFLCYNPLQSNATTLGERIKQYRIQKGLSLSRLAEELGVDSGTLARWGNGRSKPKTGCKLRV